MMEDKNLITIKNPVEQNASSTGIFVRKTLTRAIV
jgi:hypothetical protein